MQDTRSNAQLIVLVVMVIAAAGWYTLYNRFTASAQEDAGQTIEVEANALSNGKIVFERTRSIYTIDPVTRAESQIGSGKFPAWSRDGSKIAFTSYFTRGDGEINIMNPDGSNPRALTTPAFGSDPAWSPDGTKLVFIGGTNNRDIIVMNADGSGQTQLTTISLSEVNESPSWGANDKIVYGCFNSSSSTPRNICVINSTGGGQAKLTTSGSASYPAWSRDGTRIVFSQFIIQ